MKLNDRVFEGSFSLERVHRIEINHNYIEYSTRSQVIGQKLNPAGVLDLIKYLVFDCMDSNERKAFLSLLPDLPAANNSTRETVLTQDDLNYLLRALTYTRFLSVGAAWKSCLTEDELGVMEVYRTGVGGLGGSGIWDVMSDHAKAQMVNMAKLFLERVAPTMLPETAEPQAKAAHTDIDPASLTPPSILDHSSPMVINAKELASEEFMQASRVEAIGEQSRIIMIEYFRSVDSGGIPSAWPNQWMFRACQRLIRRFGEQPLRELLGFVITD